MLKKNKRRSRKKKEGRRKEKKRRSRKKKEGRRGKEIKLAIWDTAGQERFHSVALSSLKNAQGIIHDFDVANKKSFNDLDMWLSEIKNVTDQVSIIFKITYLNKLY